MSILNPINHIRHHPLTRNHQIAAFKRVAAWQIGTRLLPGPISVPYVNRSRLLISRGMTGATGCVYVGLHDFEQMSFLLHYLRPGDTFIDVGANVGSYTILASAAVGASTIAFEPVKSEYEALIANVALNNIEALVEIRKTAVGSYEGEVKFSRGGGPGSKIVADSCDGIVAPITTLDTAINNNNIRLIKVDVEGHEYDVLKGAHRVLSGAEPLVLIVEMIGLGELEQGIDDKMIHSMIIDCGFRPCGYSAFDREFKEVKSYSASSN